MEHFGGTEQGTMTIAAWMKPDNFVESRYITEYIGGLRYFSAASSSGRLRTMIYNATDLTNDWPLSNTALTAGQWSHVAFTFDAAKGYQFYKDGELDGNGYESQSGYDWRLYNYTDATSKYLGILHASPYPKHDGMLDEVMVFNQVLTPMQIRRLADPSPSGEYGKFEIEHDDAGNLTADHRGYSYEYDSENRMSRVYIDIDEDGEYNDGTDTKIAQFTYDALGRRIEKVDAIADKTTRYYYDDQRVLLETDVDASETDVRYFIYGNYIDEVLLMRDLDSSNGIPDGDYYYGHDHLYSVVVLFDGSGSVAERYEYDAYGKARVFTKGTDGQWFTADDTETIASAYVNPYTFTGRRLDVLDSGSAELMYYRARTYDPETGRFMQRDPLGINWSNILFKSSSMLIQYYDSLNNFEYVKSNPIILSDYSGLSSFWPSMDIKKYFCDKGHSISISPSVSSESS